MRRLLFVPLGLIACAGIQLPREKLGTDPGGLLFNGYTRKEIACFLCHNGDGLGATLKGPSLVDPVHDMSDEQLVEAINEGEDSMPAFKDKLSADEVRLLVAWLRVTFPGAPAGKPAQTAKP